MTVQNQRAAAEHASMPSQRFNTKGAATAATTTATAAATTKPTTSIPAAMRTTGASNLNATGASPNGGPRVSFNRDVHVKRIGKRPNEQTNYETTNLQPAAQSQYPFSNYHQLPAEFNAEDIQREAALVLAQAESHHSKAKNGDNIPTFRVKTKRSGAEGNPKKFHSLPTRQKKGERKPVARSASDASTKKPTKRPSIFGLFSRKSDTNVSQLERDPRFEDSGGRRLVRSKSDVGSTAANARKHKRTHRESKQTPNGAASNSSTKQLPTQLSPIIEQGAEEKEDYFAEQFQRERRKSDAVTVREKNESALNELLARSRSQAEVDGTLLQSNPKISASIKDKILTLKAKSNDNMHSSQLPAARLPLTKGRTVNGLVKRLSMERFSPQPVINQPAFSYIRPNEGITYAQLDLSDEPQPLSAARHNTRDVRTPLREFHSPARDIHTPPERPPRYDRNEFVTSPRVDGYGTSYSPPGATTIRISSSHSPSPWQQLSPRNLSDEDEGLGIETRKYFDEEPSKLHSKSTMAMEPPIVPHIRSVTPPREREYRSPSRDEPPVDDLGYRRTRLENRILTRRFGEGGTLERNGYQRHHSTERYLSPEQEHFETRYHRPPTNELLKKYSPERTHLDIIAPTVTTITTSSSTLPKTEKTSRYRHTKYYDDGHGGVKEVYERQTQQDNDGKPQVRETRHRERLGSYGRDYTERQDYEPKSLDSQFTGTDQYRSSPEMLQRYEMGGGVERGQQQRLSHEDHWQSSLKRDKLQQRSFDKGDSGIENDFRKESFNGDISTRWRKPTVFDHMKACDAFLRKERRDTEQQHVPRNHNFVYRERSIDDGSHFDPHLDKYPVATSTLRRRDQHSQTPTQETSTLKRNKKLGGFEKVKQLFTGTGGNSGSGSGRSSSSNLSGSKKDLSRQMTNGSSTLGKNKEQNKGKDKERYMVKEEEMRSRYREHRSNHPHQQQQQQQQLQHERVETSREPKTIDISMRRRLSTPKASPLLLKRTSSDKAKKESPLAKPEKTSWFKSLDRRSKSKSKEKLNVSVNGQTETSSMKRGKRNPPVAPAKNLRFFGDTDLDSNPPTISKASSTPRSRPSLAATSTLNRAQKYSQCAYHLDRLNASPPAHGHDYRHTLASQSSRNKSSSMHNLENGVGSTDEVDFRKRRHYSRSRELDDISESGSETEELHKQQRSMAQQRAKSLERSGERDNGERSQRYEEHAYRRSSERRETPVLSSSTTPTGGAGGDSSSSTHQRSSRAQAAPLMGPPKPARSAERRAMATGYMRERERYPAESSGTEGESSLHSQRSVVFLHATTVGAIPQPYNLRRRSISRDDLRKGGKGGQPQPLQPMTRTVSRSVSMLAPWKPKLISEGYEINYSQEQNKRMATLPRKPPPHNGASSTLTRMSRKGGENSRSAGRHGGNAAYRDDQSSLRPSSTTTSKSMLSSNLRSTKIK